jgi:hypothetical protein
MKKVAKWPISKQQLKRTKNIDGILTQLVFTLKQDVKDRQSIVARPKNL